MRKSNDGIVSGVAAGIAEYLKIDPLFIRLAFILLPSSLFIYIVCIFLMEAPLDD
jgi:phage shock protein PspC (stress-responsive transcriptional regulator)